MPADAPKLSEDTLVADGAEPLKALADADAGTQRVGAYAVRFSGPEEKDLSGEYFTAKTDFGPTNGDGVATLFNHGMCPAKGLEAVCELTFPPVKVTRDDVGLFVESTLDLSDKYQKAIANLVAKGKLKWSSGTAKHVERKSDEGEIQRWHPVEFSYTPTPCEPRLPAIRPLKSVELDPEAIADLAAALTPAPAIAPVVDSPASADTPAPASLSKTTVKLMADTLTPEQETAVKARTNEINEIYATGDQFNCREAAVQFVAAGKSLWEFKDHVLKDVVKAAPVVTSPTLGMTGKEIERYSIVKAIREWVNGGSAQKITGLEKEASEATATATKRTPDGFLIPHDVATSSLAESNNLGFETVKALLDTVNSLKTLNQTSFASGGALVSTNILTGSIIELLRNKPLVSKMGAMTLTGLMGNVAIPRINGGATAYWLNEQGSVGATDQAFGQVGFMPKKLAGRTGYTKELVNQTDLSIEALVRNDLTTVLGLAKDLAALNGTGGAQPLGIMNTTGINAMTFGGSASRAAMIQFQQKVATANASRGSLAYMTTPLVAARMMGIPEVPNFPQWLWDGNVDTGVVVGRPAETTNQVPGNQVIYGNWNDLVLLDWAGIDVVVNPYSADSQGIVTITITLWTDSGLRHEVSFCVSTDGGAQ